MIPVKSEEAIRINPSLRNLKKIYALENLATPRGDPYFGPPEVPGNRYLARDSWEIEYFRFRNIIGSILNLASRSWRERCATRAILKDGSQQFSEK